LWAARSSPDEQTLRSDTVYVRRPGGFSEPARTQDDWERLLERLVRARQAEQLDAIRNILNPAQAIVIEGGGLDEWTAQSLAAWQERIDPLPPHDNRRFEAGFWLFSFQIQPFSQPSLIALNQFLEREAPRHSGWRPFTYLHGEPRRPQAHGDLIESWLAESHDPNVPISDADAEMADFWRVSKAGRGFLLRPMQEDRADFLANQYPRPERPNFDFILPPYRAVEMLKFVQALGERFSDENASFDAMLRYVGTRNRTIVQHELRYHLHTGGRCQVDEIETRISGRIFEIEHNLPELIFRFLTPVFEQFEFTELPMALVENRVREALGF